MPTAIGTNAVPQGGPTGLQPVAPTSVPINIADLVEQLTPIQARFRQQSSMLSTMLDQVQFNAGAGSSQKRRISSVGLGLGTITKWVLTFNVANTGAAAQTVAISPQFPYNVISRIETGINGGTAVFSAGGVGGLLVSARRKRGLLTPTVKGGFGPALNPALLSLVVANGTVTNTSEGVPSFSGIASISVAAGATAVITATFATFEKYCLDRATLIGALPLQNSSTFAEITYTLASSLVGAGANAATSPFYAPGANVAVTLAGGGLSTAQSLYQFASVPSDPRLYLDMVSNSYQVQEQDGLQANATTTDALVYDIPRNAYLVAAHFVLNDNNGVYLPYAAVNPLKLRYNAGTIVVAVQEPVTWRAHQYHVYGEDFMDIPGYRLWDGEDTSDEIGVSDNMGWLDAYSAANPQLTATLASTVALPVTYNVIREQIVAGAVQVV